MLGLFSEVTLIQEDKSITFLMFASTMHVIEMLKSKTLALSELTSYLKEVFLQTN